MTGSGTPAQGDLAQSRLQATLWEADRHARAIESALPEWDALRANALAEVESDAKSLRLVDQILFRFTKLQDCLGERLVNATLGVLLEPDDSWSMRDKLDRLERLGYLDVEQWLRWRELRNRLAHEYPDQPDIRWAVLCASVAAARELALAFRRWQALVTAAAKSAAAT